MRRTAAVASILSLFAPAVSGFSVFGPAVATGGMGSRCTSDKRLLLLNMTAQNNISPGVPWRRKRNTQEAGVWDKPLYPTPIHRCFYFVLMRLVVLATRFVMKTLNTTVLHDSSGLLERLVTKRDADCGLLTISNHCSMADDPGIWGGSLPNRALTPKFVRSILMVEEFYFVFGRFSAAIFRGLKCLPLKRGDLRGLESPQLRELHSRLNGKIRYQTNQKSSRREWCHIMAEGRVLQPWRFDPYGLHRLGKLRHGAAKLIATSPTSELIVLPIFHDGMHKILPETPPPDAKSRERRPIPENKAGKTQCWFPRIGQRVDIYVGDPIDFSDLVPSEGLAPFEKKTDVKLLRAITDRIRSALLKLEKQAAEDRKSRGDK